MRPQVFGQFLLGRGEIDEAQLRQAVELMHELNSPLGVLAVGEGFATEADCQRVNEEQRRTDLPFGELAMQMGVLNSIELEELLQQQRETRVDLVSALVELGCLSDDLARDLHDSWKSAQPAQPEIVLDLPAALHGSPTAEWVVALAAPLLRRVADLEVQMGAAEALEGPVDHVLVACAEAVGTRPLRVTLMLEQRFGERLARGLLGMELDTLASELALEAVGEFLNVMMGNVIVGLEARGVELRLEPPRYGVLPDAGWMFPIVSEADGSAKLVLEPLAPTTASS
jgi:hypothetical protein